MGPIGRSLVVTCPQKRTTSRILTVPDQTGTQNKMKCWSLFVSSTSRRMRRAWPCGLCIFRRCCPDDTWDPACESVSVTRRCIATKMTTIVLDSSLTPRNVLHFPVTAFQAQGELWTPRTNLHPALTLQPDPFPLRSDPHSASCNSWSQQPTSAPVSSPLPSALMDAAQAESDAVKCPCRCPSNRKTQLKCPLWGPSSG